MHRELSSIVRSGFTDRYYRIRNLLSILADISYDSQDMYMYTKSRELKSEYWCFVMSIVVANRNDNNLNLGNYWVRNVSLNSTYFHFNNYGCKWM